MRAYILLVVFLLIAPLWAVPPFPAGKRVGFAGDSITDAKKWTAYVTAYLHLRFPELDLHINSYGRGGTGTGNFLDSGDTAYEEWHKVVYGLDLDYVIMMLGHNYEPSTDAYQTNLTNLAQNYAQAEGTTPILVGPWPQSNGTGSTTAQARSARLPLIATATGIQTWDTWATLAPVWTTSANWTALQRPGTQGTPGIHAGTTGHALMAYYFIQQMGWAGSSFTVVGTSAGSLVSSAGAAVSSLATNGFDGVDITFLPDSLPWAVDEDGGVTRTEATGMVPGFATWQPCILRVTGLAAGQYDVFATEVGGTLAQVGTVSDSQFTAGVDASLFVSGPLRSRPKLVLDAIRAQLGLSPALVRISPNAGMVRYESNASVEYRTNGLRGTALRAALADEVAIMDALDANIWAAAAPRSLTYSIRKQGVAAAVPVARRAMINRRVN